MLGIWFYNGQLSIMPKSIFKITKKIDQKTTKDWPIITPKTTKIAITPLPNNTQQRFDDKNSLAINTG